MTDIDAIRKTKRYVPRELGALSVDLEERYTIASALDAALAAYDAKCEELANACALGASLSSDLDAALIRISQLESRLRADLEHIRPLELGALSAFEQKYDAMRAERDAAVSLLRECRPIVFADHIREVGTRVLARYTLTARIDTQLAALAPPTEPMAQTEVTP